MILANTSQYQANLRAQLATSIEEIRKSQDLRYYGKPPTRTGFTDKEVRVAVLATIRAMMPTNVTNAPVGERQKATRRHSAATSTEGVTAELVKTYGRQAGVVGSISIAVIGETHQHGDAPDRPDQARAKELLAQMTPGRPLAAVDLVLLERDLEPRYKPYPQGFAPSSVLENALVDDETLRQGLSADQRDIVMAGFLLLSLAGGDQSQRDNVVAFVGARHADGLLEEFERLVTSSGGAGGVGWVIGRPRTLLSFGSQVP